MLIRKLCTRVLRDFGYQTETANDGAAAWKALQANVYDLLITDNNMPRVSGVELVKKVRSARMALPVILVSGNLPTGELESNPWLQPVATLAKPFYRRGVVGNGGKGLAREHHYLRATRVATNLQPGNIRQPSTRRIQPRLPLAALVHEMRRSRPCD